MGILTGEGSNSHSDNMSTESKYELQSVLMRSVESALDDADLILLCHDVVETVTKNAGHLDRILASPSRRSL